MAVFVIRDDDGAETVHGSADAMNAVGHAGGLIDLEGQESEGFVFGESRHMNPFLRKAVALLWIAHA